MGKIRLFILSGATHSGKTTRLHQVCKALQKNGIKLNGALSLAFFEDGEHKGYDALILQTGEMFPLARTKGASDWERIGRFYFIPEGLKKVIDAILDFHDSNLTIIDEIGPLELEQKGFWRAFWILHQQDLPKLIVLRKGLVKKLLNKIQANAVILHTNDNSICDKIIDNLLDS